ncbi:recombinase family protein [Microbacterium sp. No. 7]|uniref:recombinase family protein n=1 Tax=Microbacterium sp. No. 7 TaxID=1714373 RepID=UPI0006D107A5|nr:recombinase family protein [Microbacterium sp. No. 7]ALJ22275.1 dehydrogenase [Microbacterium sp. No. 7]
MTDDAADRSPADYAESVALPTETAAVPIIVSREHWWAARPAGSRLVGLVVARDDMPSIIEQRDALAQFGVPIEGFRHPAPETGESWEERLTRLFGHLGSGDVVVVADKHALGRDVEEETRTLAELRRRGVIVKVLSAEHR